MKIRLIKNEIEISNDKAMFFIGNFEYIEINKNIISVYQINDVAGRNPIKYKETKYGFDFLKLNKGCIK